MQACPTVAAATTPIIGTPVAALTPMLTIIGHAQGQGQAAIT